MSDTIPDTHRAVRLHPNDRSIKVETIPAPRIQGPDDAIVKISYAGLCGSDLHAYRGHEQNKGVVVTGHEFVGVVVALGSSYSSNTTGRPTLYGTLKVGDKVVAPFTSSCAECQSCRVGFTSRCAHQLLFGSDALPGAQAQYVRVPKAGGTLFVIDKSSTLDTVPETSLLLLADILPTGCFAALQMIQHPNILPVLSGRRYPLPSMGAISGAEPLVAPLLESSFVQMSTDDRTLTLVLIGLGPVGICTLISLLDMLSILQLTTNLTRLQLLAVDLISYRRDKAQAVFTSLASSVSLDFVTFKTAGPEEALAQVEVWTDGVGCNGVLEIVGAASALSLALNLIRPFGTIISAGVHHPVPLPNPPFTGSTLYNKNASLSFGRCPVRAVFPLAVQVLSRHAQEGGVFAEVRENQAGTSVVVGVLEKVVGIEDAPEAYRAFDKGEVGKVVFKM